MDGLVVADLKGVLAPLNFTQPMAEKPYSYNYEPPPGVPVRNTSEETHQVKILDARAVNDRLSLDHQGFVLLRHPTAAADLMTRRRSPGSTIRNASGLSNRRP